MTALRATVHVAKLNSLRRVVITWSTTAASIVDGCALNAYEQTEITMKAIDYEKESNQRLNWLDITGGAAKDNLTVLDYFAVNVAQELCVWLDKGEDPACDFGKVVYDLAEMLLKERNKRFTPPNVVRGVTGKTYG